MEKYQELLKRKGADLTILIDAKSVVTAAWTRYKCKFGCNSYGKNHCCPPNTPTYKETREIIDCFSRAILFRTHNIEKVTPMAVEVARELFLDGYYKAIAFGAGDCQKCKVCNVQHCNFPKETVPSMEACGIDVFETVRNNGLEISTLRDRDEIPNFFGLILVD